MGSWPFSIMTQNLFKSPTCATHGYFFQVKLNTAHITMLETNTSITYYYYIVYNIISQIAQHYVIKHYKTVKIFGKL